MHLWDTIHNPDDWTCWLFLLIFGITTFCNTFVCSCWRRYLLLSCSEMIDATCSVNFFKYFFHFLQKSLGVCCSSTISTEKYCSIELEFCYEAKAPVSAELPAANTSIFAAESSCDTLWTYKCIFPTGGYENPSIISWPPRQKTVTFLKKRFQPGCCSSHVVTTYQSEEIISKR